MEIDIEIEIEMQGLITGFRGSFNGSSKWFDLS